MDSTFLAGVSVPSTSKRTSVFFIGRSERGANLSAIISSIRGGKKSRRLRDNDELANQRGREYAGIQHKAGNKLFSN